MTTPEERGSGEERERRITEIRSLLAETVTRIETGTPNHYWNFCVNCGTPLDSRKCKLFCPVCGFYHNCSEP
ncbi:MAG: hypothetical protein F9K22_11940 [Bacteroidetes bacterium]|nr:MAG: hypothetical protein F9K22_11940 [Bacteroidota bacterium]